MLAIIKGNSYEKEAGKIKSERKKEGRNGIGGNDTVGGKQKKEVV